MTSQHIDPATESWPWDDLLDSPESGSFQSASTTYDPPSVDSLPDSYNSSTGSETALLTAEQLWDPLTESSHQPSYHIAASHPRPILPSSALPPLAPKGACPSGPAPRQLGQSTERRRVPRPRFRLSNQKPSMTRRSLLADLDAAKDTSDADGGHFYVDYSFRASSLIKAHVVPLPQEDLEQWFVHRPQDGMIGYQVSCCSVVAWHHMLLSFEQAATILFCRQCAFCILSFFALDPLAPLASACQSCHFV